jgi:hypothetical protein
MKSIKLLFVLILLVSTQCKAQSDDQIRMKLQKDESSQPANYLKAENTNCTNVITQKADLLHVQKIDKNKWNITGQIKSYATMANFKDAILTVSFYTQTMTFLGSRDFPIYQYLMPNSSVPFQIITYAPNGFSSFNVKVKSATPIY